jgi:HSP20 family protein
LDPRGATAYSSWRCSNKIAGVARIVIDRWSPREQLGRWLEAADLPELARAAAEYAPAVAIIETDTTVEVLMDLPGVAPDAVEIVFGHGSLRISGTKQPRCEHREAAFHLAERAFGRFSRVLRLAGALDVRRATAALSSGELRVVLPRLAERRGQEIPIAIKAD